MVRVIIYVTCREERDVREQGKIFQGESLKEWLTTKIALSRVLCNHIMVKVN